MISCCIATYNGGRYLKYQILSILNQLSEHDEIIISDDQSTDNTLDIIRSFNDDRIKIFNHKKEFCSSSSAYAAKNFENAISHAKGDIIFLSDQDDVWLPNKVRVMTEYLKNYDLVISDAYVTDSNLNVLYNTRFYPGCGQTKNLFKAYISTHPYQGSCMAFRSSILRKALPFPKGVTSHDTWLGYIGSTFYKVKLIPEKLMYYRRHDNVVSITGEKSDKPVMIKVRNRLKYLVLLILRGCKLI
nr:glycosyltransferase [Parabacteroides sp. ZJ-118]